MAVNKYFREQGYVNSRPDINGNKEHVAYNILTGQGGKNFLSDSYGRIPDMWFSDSQIDNFNKTNHITCVGRNYGSENKSAYGKECGSDNKVELHSNHAYAVKGSDKDYVYLVNPWDTRDGAIIKVPRGTFKDFFNSIDEFDLE